MDSADFGKRASGLLRSVRESSRGSLSRASSLVRARAAKALESGKATTDAIERSGFFRLKGTNGTATGSIRRRSRASAGGSYHDVHSSAAAWSRIDGPEMLTLCKLGFSAAACQRALEQCHGHMEEAGSWLVDPANADEISAAEKRAASSMDVAAGLLAPGCAARITGLKGAAHFNGTLVALLAWDEESSRWLVEMPDSSKKALRARNLERRGGHASIPTALGAQVQAKGATSVHPGQATGANDAAANRSDLELRSHACRILSTKMQLPETEIQELLSGMSRVEIHELLEDCSVDDQGASVAAEATERTGELQRRCQDDQVNEGQSLIAQEVGSGKVEPKASVPIVNEQPEISAMDVVPIVNEQPEISAMDVQREELQRLKDEAERATQELHKQREQVKRAAEDRELQLLEQEGEQLRAMDALNAEREHLDRQKRTALILQEGALRLVNKMPNEPGGCLEVQLDDSQCKLEEPYAAGAHAESGGSTAVDDAQTKEGVPSDEDADDEVWDLDWAVLDKSEPDQTRAGGKAESKDEQKVSELSAADQSKGEGLAVDAVRPSFPLVASDGDTENNASEPKEGE